MAARPPPAGSRRAVLAALLLAAAVATVSAADAAKGGQKTLPPGKQKQLNVTRALKGPGAPKDVGCDPSPIAGTWLEMTNLGNYSQFKTTGSAPPDNVTVEFPFMLTEQDVRAPGFSETCMARSPSAPADCQGDACFVYLQDFGAQWLEFGELLCYQSYPTPGLTDFFTSPAPPQGAVNMILTNQDKVYTYSDWFYSVTDEWGNKWALQTYQSSQDQSLADSLAGVQWPAGWGPVQNVSLPAGESQTQVPWVADEDGTTFWFILKDSADHTWHMYTYPNGSRVLDNSLPGAVINNCTWMDAAFTLSQGGGSSAPAPAPATAAAPYPTPVAAPAASGAAARAVGALAALAAAAVALLA